MGRQTGVGGSVGRGREAGAVGRASEEKKVMPPTSPLTLATSGEFLKLCFSVGIVKVVLHLLLQLSNFSFDRVS